MEIKTRTKGSIIRDAKYIESKDIKEEIISYIKEMEYDWCNDMVIHQWKKSILLDQWLTLDLLLKEGDIVIFNLKNNESEIF